jgi:oligosaccharide reducing-end xylanase
MRSSSGPTAGLLRWRCDTTGTDCATNASTDASSIIATALLIADSRFGQVGVHDYNSEALELLEVLVAIEERNGGVVDGVVNCFDGVAALPRAESTNPESLVPVDYLMPAFYEIWAERDVAHGSFWRKVATNSRALLVAASHKTTGLLPEKLNYDGTPVAGFENYRPTTARTHLNLFLDHTWYGPSSWIVQQNSLRLRFFLSQGVDEYVTEYTPSGAPLSNYNTAAHRSLVALAAGTTSNPDYDVFLERLLAEPIPSGTFRYYDGMLYMLSLLALSGQMTSD